MPLYAWLLFLAGPSFLAVLRLATWIARLLGYPRDARPGYITDLAGRK